MGHSAKERNSDITLLLSRPSEIQDTSTHVNELWTRNTPFFFNPFGLLIKRNNKQTQNTVKDAGAYDSHSDWSINMTLCKVPDIFYFQLLFLFYINGNRNF